MQADLDEEEVRIPKCLQLVTSQKKKYNKLTSDSKVFYLGRYGQAAKEAFFDDYQFSMLSK